MTELSDFASKTAETLERIAAILTRHEKELQDLGRLVSALDTRLDRVEVRVLLGLGFVVEDKT